MDGVCATPSCGGTKAKATCSGAESGTIAADNLLQTSLYNLFYASVVLVVIFIYAFYL